MERGSLARDKFGTRANFNGGVCGLVVARRMGLGTSLPVAMVVRPVCAREYIHNVYNHMPKINIETQ